MNQIRLRSPRSLSLLASLGLCLLPARGLATDTVDAAPLTVESTYEQAFHSVDQQVVVEGTVIGVCHSGGRKCFLRDAAAGPKGKTLRVERTADLPAFPQELKGDTIRVTGIVRELRYDAAYLDAWEERVKAQLSAEEKNEENCEGDCEANLAAQTALKRIAAYRERIATNGRGYLSSFWLDGLKWEIVPAAGE